MRLIGKLDSPYVRRVAVSMHQLDVPFQHEDLSVFRDYAAFEGVNSVVKAPTLVTDDGTVLLDSTLILDFIERSLPPDQRLAPADLRLTARHHRIVGLALAACEKTVQIVYEHELRPEEKRHAPWIERVGRQLGAAYALLESEFASVDRWVFGAKPTQADLTTAVAWRFTRDLLPGRLAAAEHPRLEALSDRAEALPAFLRAQPV